MVIARYGHSNEYVDNETVRYTYTLIYVCVNNKILFSL